MLIFTDTMQTHNKNINDRQQSWLDAQKAARPLYWRYVFINPIKEDRVKLFLIVFSLILASGCATTKNSYISPDISNEPTASIENTWIRNSLFDWEGFYVQAVDNKYISDSFFSDPGDASNRVLAGEHLLFVYSEYNRNGAGGCPCEAFANVSFNFKEGRDYRLSGQINGAEVYFFIVDNNSGKRVSEIFGTNTNTKPQSYIAPVYIQ
jgi:hypothetical protein